MSGTAEAGTRDEHDIVDGLSPNLFQCPKDNPVTAS